MTTLEDLPKTPATLSPNLSMAVLEEVYAKSSWRCYLSTESLQTKSLTKRFLASHAQVPGGISETMQGFVPIHTFRYTAGETLYEGYLFLNGAVVHVVNRSGKGLLSLFIDEATADMWGYPPKFLSYEARRTPNRDEKPGDKEVNPVEP